MNDNMNMGMITSEAFSTLSTDAPVSSVELARMYTGLQKAQMICHALALHSGWWKAKDGTPIDPNDPNVFGTKMALIHSEVSEALEGGRKNKDDDHLHHRKSVEVELADALIRIFDTAGAMQLDLAGAVVEKLAYNQRRPDHKHENRFAEGGKVF